MRRIELVLLLVVLTLIGGIPAGAGGGGCHEFTEGETAEVTLDSNCFGPTVTRVLVGTTVTWHNGDTWEHNVFSPAFADSGIIAAGGSYSYTFEEEGVFPYVCTLHPGMMGAVVVGGPAQVETPRATSATSFGIPVLGGVVILVMGLFGGWAFTRRATRSERIDP